MTRKITVICPGENLSGFPGGRNLIEGLSKAFDHIEVHIVGGKDSLLPQYPSNVVYKHPVDRLRRSAIFPRTLTFALRTLLHFVLRRKSTDFIVGIDRAGVILAWIIAKFSGTRYAGMIVEFYLPPKWSGWRNRLGNWIERFAWRNCFVALVQDRQRGDFLCKLTGMSPSRVMLFPNSPFGSASPEKTTVLRDRHGIPTSKIILLNAGVLDYGTRYLDLLRVAGTLPEPFVFVFQSSQRMEISEEEKKAWEAVDPAKVFINRTPLPFEEVEPMVRSADIGVALYRVLSDNTKVKGAAAGKLAMYLKCGLPVIIQDLETFLPFIEKYECGVAIRDETQLAVAAKTVMENYQLFARGALACYEHEFALDRHMEAFIDRIKAQSTLGRE